MPLTVVHCLHRPLCRFALLLMLASGLARADVKLPALFGDNMVLQRGQPVVCWGKADAGEEVKVEIAGNTISTVADAAGAWRVSLPALENSAPFSLVVSGKNRIELRNVVMGEVWVASGQSNMEWPLRTTDAANVEIEASRNPAIRIFKVARALADAPQVDVKGKWLAAAPETSGSFTAVGYYFAKQLQAKLGVPVGIIDSTWGGTPAAAWTPKDVLENNPAFAGFIERFETASAVFPEKQKEYEEKYAAWKTEVGSTPTLEQSRRRPYPPLGPGHPSTPSGLFKAMIHPLLPLRIRGVIWYQGEADATRAATYRELFPAMIESWRRDWQIADLPFLYVQLANYRERKPEPAESDWAELREAQRTTLKLANTGMAVAIDVGDALDIHPRNKRTVGERLAAIAEAKVYGRESIYAGPTFASMASEPQAIRLRFTDTAGRLMPREGTVLKGFSVAGEDRKFYWADARIEGDQIIVSSSQVRQPVAARYGWADNPEVNLVNRAGFPASPFRTDSWPGVTDGR